MNNFYNEYLPAVAMACFVLAAIAGLRRGRIYSGVFVSVLIAVGSLCCWAMLIIRGQLQESLPLRSMFEIFILLGGLIWPTSLFCSRYLKAPAPVVDALLGTLVMLPAFFVFDRSMSHISVVLQSPLFLPHVLAYMLSYIIVTRAAVFAASVIMGAPGIEKVDLQLRLALGFMTIGLVLGAIWGKMAWSDWWNWDPKELWSLATWCVFVSYFVLRSEALGKGHARIAAGVAILGFAFVVITLLWVNLSRVFDSMHSYV